MHSISSLASSMPGVISITRGDLSLQSVAMATSRKSGIASSRIYSTNSSIISIAHKRQALGRTEKWSLLRVHL